MVQYTHFEGHKIHFKNPKRNMFSNLDVTSNRTQFELLNSATVIAS